VRKEKVGRSKWVAGFAGSLGVAALALLVLLALSAGGSNGGYTVRAIFDDAGNVISGEDVKVEGVKIGSVGSVTPTPQAKAAVVLKIENPGFQDFRSDASCTVRPQALIGEKYVDCTITQPRAEGAPLPPPLRKIPSGKEGEGEYLLPVANTHSPVDVDLLGDIDRLPERERLTIILNELGAGLAGRGSDLAEVIRRANPALQEFDRVLAILSEQRQVLAKLNTDSAKALAPLAAQREHFADFLVQSNKVAQATAAHRGALARNLKDFPPFLEQLGPAAERIERFADQATPVATDLKAAAPSIDRTFTELPGFSKSSTTFFESVGKTSKLTGPALTAAKPLLARLKALGAAGKPTATSLAELLGSLRDTGGLERIMDFIFLGTGASNGYDALGHFLRGEIVPAASCLTFGINPAEPKCNRKLFNTSSGETATASAASVAGTSLTMERTLAVLKGATPAQAIAKYPGSVSGETATSAGSAGGSATTTQPVGGSSAGTTYYTPSSEGSEAGGLLLNYLLGN
jgi:phospholipid/cholesterol/gamma-HCH transport system substrate-binding protein